MDDQRAIEMLDGRIKDFYYKNFSNIKNKSNSSDLYKYAKEKFLEKDVIEICEFVQSQLEQEKVAAEAFFVLYGITSYSGNLRKKVNDKIQGFVKFRTLYARCLSDWRNFKERKNKLEKVDTSSLKLLHKEPEDEETVTLRKQVLYLMNTEMQAKILIYAKSVQNPSESFKAWRKQLETFAAGEPGKQEEQKKTKTSSENSDQEKSSGEKRQEKEQDAPPAAPDGRATKPDAKSPSTGVATAPSILNKPSQPGIPSAPPCQEKGSVQKEKREDLKDMLYAAPERPSREWEDKLDRLAGAELGQRTIRISDRLLTLAQDKNRPGFNALLDSVRRTAKRTGDMSVFIKIMKHMMDEEDKAALGFLENYIASALIKSGQDDANEWKAYIQSLMPKNPISMFLRDLFGAVSQQGARLWSTYQKNENDLEAQQENMIHEFTKPMEDLECELSDLAYQIKSDLREPTLQDIRRIMEFVQKVHEAFGNFGIKPQETQWDEWKNLTPVPFDPDIHDCKGELPLKGTEVRLRSMGFRQVGKAYAYAQIAKHDKGIAESDVEMQGKEVQK